MPSDRNEASRRRARLTREMLTHAAIALALLAPTRSADADDPFLRHTITVKVAKDVGPAVVNITTERDVRGGGLRPFGRDPFFDSFFRDFFEPRLPRKTQSLGSGVVIDPEGHILTNEHVVARASRIRIAFADGREFDAELVGADPNNDVAVLKAKSDEKLPWIPLGSSEDLMVGEPVIAIGNPFGLSSTVTTGVISALDRSIRTENLTYHGFLQTDASINPGNSGGPLLNAHGSLIAINTAVYQGGQGIGFAIPIDTAGRVVRELIEEGEVSPVWLGIEFQDLTPDLIRALDLPASSAGALVNQVRAGSPAARADVRRGDVVTKLAGRPIRNARSFFEMLDAMVEGQELELRLLRAGAERRASLTAEEVPKAVIDALVRERIGLELQPAVGGGYAVVEVRPGSGAERIGLEAGDLILGINGRALEDGNALRSAALDLRGRSRARIVVARRGGRYHVTVPLL
ncbi:MAG: trypsin-like peptidase domain-containing protein [Deltaproteobacteria bacterium]|nr:trypsin-like peptidase domain-containing protein [Deltaproteobacteria bacterium]